MSIAVHRAVPSTSRLPTDAPSSATRPTDAAAADRLLGTLRTTLEACAEVDPDELASVTPAGRSALVLAEIARAAAGGGYGEPGTALTHAPGIVVVRDLAVATSVLAASARSGGSDADLRDLAAEADRRARTVIEAVTPPVR